MGFLETPGKPLVFIGELRILGVMTGEQKYHQVHILRKLGSY